MGPSNGPLILFKLPSEGGPSGGGGNGGESSQGHSHAQEQQIESSQGHTQAQEQQASEEAATRLERERELMRAINAMAPEFRHIIGNPQLIYQFMTARMGILNYYPQFTTEYKKQIVLEAFSRINNTPTMPNRLSDRALYY